MCLPDTDARISVELNKMWTEQSSGEEKSSSEGVFIVGLSQRVETLEFELNLERKNAKVKAQQLRSIKTKFKQLKSRLQRYLGSVQLHAMVSKKVTKWSNSTLKKSNLIKSKGGSGLLNFVRNHVAPLPSPRVVNKRLEKLKFLPGVLEKNMDSLKNYTIGLLPVEKEFLLLFDEKAVVKSLSYDSASDF